MPKQIDELTPAQTARMAEWRDKWIQIGLCTDPADRATFEAAIAQCYRAAGLPPPRRVVWVQSPIVLALAAPIASLLLSRQRGDAVRDAVGGAVGDAVDGAVGVAVRDAVDGAVGDAVRGAISRSWYRIIGGQFWVGGWGWYGSPSVATFFLDVCGLDLSEDMQTRARAYAATASSACWWWPHRDFVMVCDRPRLIQRDAAGRLHREDGPAVEFRDGWGVHAWHGVRVPPDVITSPDRITTERINGETNAEIRRVMLERFGVARYVRESGATVLHADTDQLGFPRRLLRRDVPNDEPIVMVELTNSTPEPDGTRKTYHLRVHPELRPMLGGDRLGEPQAMTAHNAVASTFGMRGEEYAPREET